MLRIHKEDIMIGRIIRTIIKIKLVVFLIIIVLIGLVIWAIVSFVGGLFGGSNAEIVTLDNSRVAVLQEINVVPSVDMDLA